MNEGGDTLERRGVDGFYLRVEDSPNAVMRVAATKSLARIFAQEWTGPGSNTRPAAEAPKDVAMVLRWLRWRAMVDG